MSDITLDLSSLTPSMRANFCGSLNQHIKAIENFYDISLQLAESEMSVISPQPLPEYAVQAIEHLLAVSREQPLTAEEVESTLRSSSADFTSEDRNLHAIRLKRQLIRPKTRHQHAYIQNIERYTFNFGIGPAGTGKTYLAVAMAVQALEREEVSRLILTRPAVEAGERLGFLPGDLSQKVDPYLRPVYDALYEMLGFEKVEKLISRHIIEVAPLAYMRGRTLNNAFVILDEGQNTTPSQMKMFLTRIGFGSKAVVTGDLTQNDLVGSQVSGLSHSLDILKPIKEIGFNYFGSEDIVRHRLVQHIVEAYERHKQ